LLVLSLDRDRQNPGPDRTQEPERAFGPPQVLEAQVSAHHTRLGGQPRLEELKQVETNLVHELRTERQALRQDRQATDEDLANERRNTDEAVEHVQGLLAEERRDHAHTVRGVATRNEFRIRVARAGTFCLVSVSDTGVGIPDGELTGIFERLRQLNPSDHTGLGLGLYISQWIVEAHGGRIWAESQVGVGTTFHFILPEERWSS
jgi:light-regulated signal transduction histidine kinase (bacteriophytochrome)